MTDSTKPVKLTGRKNCLQFLLLLSVSIFLNIFTP